MTPELNWLSDPTVFAVNRLDAHSDHVCYRTVQEAAQRHSSLRQPLDGMWRFVWSSCPAQRPADFWREGADLSGFGTIRVPLRYNYDKPEKPRISRAFGYLARFFILFQTEKSSREVVIS